MDGQQRTATPRHDKAGCRECDYPGADLYLSCANIIGATTSCCTTPSLVRGKLNRWAKKPVGFFCSVRRAPVLPRLPPTAPAPGRAPLRDA